MRSYSIPGTFVGNDYLGRATEWAYTASSGTKSDPSSTPLVFGKHVHPTAYSADWVDMEPGDLVMHLSRKRSDYHDTLEPAYCPAFQLSSVSFSDISFSNLKNKAIVNAGQTEMSLGETLAESRSTFTMFKTNLEAIAEATIRFRRGDYRGAFGKLNWQFPKKSADKYLEFTFGLMPLVGEVNNGIKVLHKGLAGPNPNGIVHGFASASQTIDYHSSTYTSTAWGRLKSAYYACRADAKVKLTYRYQHPSVARTANQLGLLNVPQLAWNLTPMSFVADWILPVDDFLGAFGSTQGITFLDGYQSFYATANWTAECWGSTHFSATTKFCTRPAKREAGRFYRAGVGPIPALPEFRLPSHIGQAVTASALSLQRLLR